MKRDKLPALPTLALLVFALGAAWKGLYELAVVCIGLALVMTFFDARQEAAYQRAEAAGISMRGNRAADLLFDLVMRGFALLAVLVMLGVISNRPAM